MPGPTRARLRRAPLPGPQRRTAEEPPAATAAAWEPADGTTFSVRSLNYMRSKVKEASGPCIYQ